MFDWTREQAPLAKAAGIPVLSQEQMKQVSGAGFILAEDGFILAEDGFILAEDGFILAED
ncbi:MAG: hypothetical protein JNK55_01625 [Rubrivivax sp.]|nr:hypothetical protein [Rubrivivax sp.]